jgi:predicted PurR-regulated permease PerM
MFRIALLFFSLIATTLAGSAVVVALTLGYDTLAPILWAAGLGLVAALPVTWLIAREISQRG